MKIDKNKLNWYCLNKQNLVVSNNNTPGDILREQLGLHSTDYLTPYFSLWARIDKFNPTEFFEGLKECKSALRMRVFRGTVFVIHRENLSFLLPASKIFLYLRFKEIVSFAEKNGIDLRRIGEDICGLLEKNNSLSVSEIKKGLNFDVDAKTGMIIPRYLDLSGKTIRTGQRYITDKIVRYGLTEEWFPEVKDIDMKPEEALTELILKYIRLFGPVTLDDICWWLSAKKTIVRKILEEQQNETENVIIDEIEYLMERGDKKQFEKFDISVEEKKKVIFLAYEDHFPKAYKNRDRFLDKETSPLVFEAGERKYDWGQLRPSIWVDGEIVGRWEYEWRDSSKRVMKIDVRALNEAKIHTKSVYDDIQIKRAELEEFTNTKLVPLMKK